MNLCINARDAMPKGGRLLIETGMVEVDSSYSRFYPGVAAGRYAVLSVSDTVVGTADFSMSTASRGKEVCFAYTSRPCRGSGRSESTGTERWRNARDGNGTDRRGSRVHSRDVAANAGEPGLSSAVRERQRRSAASMRAKYAGHCGAGRGDAKTGRAKYSGTTTESFSGAAADFYQRVFARSRHANRGFADGVVSAEAVQPDAPGQAGARRAG